MNAVWHRTHICTCMCVWYSHGTSCTCMHVYVCIILSWHVYARVCVYNTLIAHVFQSVAYCICNMCVDEYLHAYAQVLEVILTYSSQWVDAWSAYLNAEITLYKDQVRTHVYSLKMCTFVQTFACLCAHVCGNKHLSVCMHTFAQIPTRYVSLLPVLLPVCLCMFNLPFFGLKSFWYVYVIILLRTGLCHISHCWQAYTHMQATCKLTHTNRISNTWKCMYHTYNHTYNHRYNMLLPYHTYNMLLPSLYVRHISNLDLCARKKPVTLLCDPTCMCMRPSFTQLAKYLQFGHTQTIQTVGLCGSFMSIGHLHLCTHMAVSTLVFQFLHSRWRRGWTKLEYVPLFLQIYATLSMQRVSGYAKTSAITYTQTHIMFCNAYTYASHDKTFAHPNARAQGAMPRALHHLHTRIHRCCNT